MTANEPLTDRQSEILDYLKAFKADHGYAPTIREIGARFNITSPNGVMCHMRALASKGAIVMPEVGVKRQHRVIEIIGDEREILAKAAPDLLAALERLVAYVQNSDIESDPFDGALKQARRAIQKAKPAKVTA